MQRGRLARRRTLWVVRDPSRIGAAHRRVPPGRRVLALIFGAAMLAPIGAAAPSSETRAVGCRAVTVTRTAQGAWSAIPLPKDLRQGLAQEAYAYAVAPLEPERLFATDGATLVRSTDGGCTWRGVFALTFEDTGEASLTPSTHAISSIVMPEAAAARNRVYAVVASTSADITGADLRPHVYGSTDAGATWQALDTSSMSGIAVRLWVAAADPRVLYLATKLPTDVEPHGRLLYMSRDGGRTWSLRSVLPPQDELGIGVTDPPVPQGHCPRPGLCTGVEFALMELDPLDADELWDANREYERSAIWKSPNAARTWTSILSFAGFEGATALDVFHRPGRDARIAVFVELAYQPAQQGLFWSRDGGRTWERRPIPWTWNDPITSLAHGPGEEDLVVTLVPERVKPGEAHRLGHSGWERLSAPKIAGAQPDLSSASADRTRASAYTFLAQYPKDAVSTFALLRLEPSEYRPTRPRRPCHHNARIDGWERIPTPLLANLQQYGAHAVDPDDPARIYVTDVDRVMRSHDGGCTWTEVLSLPLVKPGTYPFDASTTTVAEIAIPARGKGNRRAVIALSEDQGTTRPRPHVLVTDDDGGNWRVADAGLLPIGQPRAIAVAPSDPDVVYLGVSVGDTIYGNGEQQDLAASPLLSLLYVSTDEGETWTPRKISGTVTGRVRVPIDIAPGRLRSFMVDPVEAMTLWAASERGEIWRSADGGRNWRLELGRRSAPGIDVRNIAVFHERGTPASVLALDPGLGVVWATDDPDSGLWLPTYTGAFQTLWQWSTSIAFGADRNTAIVGTWKGVFRLVRPPGSAAYRLPFWLPVDVSPDDFVLGIVTDRTGEPAFIGSGYIEPYLLRYRLTDLRGDGRRVRCLGQPRRDLPPELRSVVDDLCGITPYRPPKREPPRLDPIDIDLFLEPGMSRTIPYTLTLPSAPVDVYFLVDSSVSMSTAILAMQRAMTAMVDELRDAAIDVHFGLGEYRTYNCPGNPEEFNFAYRRDRDVSPPGPELGEQILALEGHGQSGSALTALYQAATGAGQDIIPPGLSRGDIPAGMQANFRSGGLRVIVNMTDRYFNTPDRDPGTNVEGGYCTYATWPGPTFEEAIAALRAERIHQIGILVSDGEPEISLRYTDGLGAEAIDDLRRVAAETRALAPKGGIDCNGDGAIDIAAGDPVVCTINRRLDEGFAELLAQAVSHTVQGLPVLEHVRFSEPTASGVVSAITPGGYRNVDLNGPARLEFSVTYSCSKGAGTFPAQIVGSASNGISLTTTARVHCGTLPVVPPVVRPFAIAPLPPLPPAPGQAPGPQPGQEPQTQGQPEAHAAVAPGKQEQPQTALVRVTQAIQEQEQELAFVRRERTDPSGAAKAPLGVAAAVMTAAYGWLSLARQRAQVRRVRR